MMFKWRTKYNDRSPETINHIKLQCIRMAPIFSQHDLNQVNEFLSMTSKPHSNSLVNIEDEK